MNNKNNNMDIIPIRSYSNAQKDQKTILMDNVGKSGVYR